MTPSSILRTLFALVAIGGTALAESTIVAQYKMGELEIADGATEGATATTLLPTIGTTNLTAVGTPILQAGGPAAARGGSTQSMRFDGGTQRYQVTGNLLGTSTTNNWMLEAWVRPQAGGSGLGFVVSHGDGGKGQILNYDAGANKYGWFVGGVGQFNGTVGATGVGTAWDHLALVRSGGATSLYVNGVFAGSNTELGTTPFNDGNGIGSQFSGGGDHGFTGDIDEVYFSTISGTFDSATDLHMSAPTDPVIVVPATAVDAGVSAVNTTYDFSVAIHNAGSANTLTITAVSPLIGDTDLFILQTVLPLTIDPGFDGVLTFRYAPGAAVGSHNAIFTVANNDVNKPNPSITLTGTAISDPNMEVADALDFGSVPFDGGPRAMELVVHNTAFTNALTVTAEIMAGGDPYFSITAPITEPIWAGSADSIEVSYDPAGNLGTHSAVLRITSNDPDFASADIALSGSAAPRFTTIARYHLGESDTDLATTIDDAGDYDLTNINATPGTSYNAGAGVTTGSTKGIDHTLNDVYNFEGIPSELAGRNKNWGLQAWIRPEPSTGSDQTGAGFGGLYFGVGNGSQGGFSVFSVTGSAWGVNIGGISSENSPVAIIGGKWTHVAAVSLNDQTRLYVNGILAHTYGGLAYAPDNNAGGQPGRIELGGQTSNSWRTAGGGDEASVFTFLSGVFNPATDLDVTPPADADGDGLLDVWENKYFGANNGVVTWADLGATDGSGDADGDGHTDGEEYAAGTDPRDASSYLAITAITRTGSTATVSFNGGDGTTYVFQKSTTLGIWDDLDTATLSGSTTGSFSDTAATEPSAFYRVKRQ